ncbi:UNVERIFIED_CONTAM: apolipoprotein N-acyltransferase [Paenibacillus sp. PvR008]
MWGDSTSNCWDNANGEGATNENDEANAGQLVPNRSVLTGMSLMPIQQKLAALWQYIVAHSRNMILSLILLYALVGMFKTSSLWSAMAGVLLGIVYLVLLWSAKWLLHSGKRMIAVIGIWMLTAFYWIAFDAGELVFALLCYLIAYIVLRLPILRSVLLTLAIITADAVILHMQHVYSSDIMGRN